MNWTELKNKYETLCNQLKYKVKEQFFRIIDIESTTLSKDDKNNFIPRLKRGQVVMVDFVGLGSVLDRPHFAVVWDAQPKNEHIVVIPITSKTREGKDYFEIGAIDGLVANAHVVKCNQPQSVSRKSIKIWYKKNQNGKKIIVKLNEFQLKKTEELFRISQLREPTLQKVLKNTIGLNVPISETDVYFDDLTRPVHYFLLNDELHYKVYQNEPVKSIKLSILGISSQERKTLLENLFSDDSTRRAEAENEIKSKLKELQTVKK